MGVGAAAASIAGLATDVGCPRTVAAPVIALSPTSRINRVPMAWDLRFREGCGACAKTARRDRRGLVGKHCTKGRCTARSAACRV